MTAALEVCSVTKHFGRTLALDNVNLDVAAGQSVALLGPNGAGKSTLMRVCATLLRPNHGAVRIFGQDTIHGAERARKRVGLISHDTFLYPDLTVTENLLFYARLFGIARPAVRAQALIERLDLATWASRPLRALSRGAQQRCALARVLLHEPELLLLDEPFTGLDLTATAALREVLADAHRRGTTVVMSSHDLARCFELCSAAVVLVRGRPVWQGTIDPTQAKRFEDQYRSLITDREARVCWP